MPWWGLTWGMTWRGEGRCWRRQGSSGRLSFPFGLLARRPRARPMWARGVWGATGKTTLPPPRRRPSSLGTRSFTGGAFRKLGLLSVAGHKAAHPFQGFLYGRQGDSVAAPDIAFPAGPEGRTGDHRHLLLHQELFGEFF